MNDLTEKKSKGIGIRTIAQNGGTAFSLFLALVLAGIVFAIISPNHVFLKPRNFSNLLVNSSITSIMAAGCTVAMLLGGMDIAQYSVATLSSITAAILMQNGTPVALAIIIMLLISAVAGAINGAFVAYLQIPAVVTTMGSMQVFRGIAYIISNAKTVMIEEPAYLVVGRSYIFNVIPVSVILMVIVYLVTFYMLKYTSFGRKVFAVGGNKQASYLSGISAPHIQFGAMMYSALCAGIAGFLLSSQTGAAIPSSGAGSEMSILSGVILGGISLSGGKGKISGTVLGVLVIATIKNGLTLCNINAFIQMIVEGSILVAAVFLDLMRNGAYKRAN